MYLGFNYDLARGMQEELLRWAEEQRKIKRVRAHRRVAEELRPLPRQDDGRPIGERELDQRRAS